MLLNHNLHSAFAEMVQRFKTLEGGYVKINEILHKVTEVDTEKNIVVVSRKGRHTLFTSEDLYKRWTVVNGVLHYIRYVNKGFNNSKVNLICAE